MIFPRNILRRKVIGLLVVAVWSILFGKGVWVTKHLWSFTQTTRVQKLLLNREPTDWQVNLVVCRCSTRFLGPFRTFLNVDIEMRQWRHNWSLITNRSRLWSYHKLFPADSNDTKGKKPELCNSLPKKPSWHPRITTMAENFRDLFWNQDGKFCLQHYKTTQKYHRMFFSLRS